VRDRLQEIAAGAVDLRERDERAPEIVSAPVAQAEHLEVEAEGVLRLRTEALGMLRVGTMKSSSVGGRP
jgi:hypothetical protein